MNENARLEFFDELTSLLKGNVKPKSEDTINGEAFCDALKVQITKLLEETHKLDILSDDFNLSSFISENVDLSLIHI